MMHYTNTRVELVSALRLCAMRSDAAVILHEPTGTRFRFPELCGTTVVAEPVLGPNGRALPQRMRERTLTVEEELALRQRRIASAIKAINKQPKKQW